VSSLAEAALASAALNEVDGATLRKLRWTLLRAYAGRAEDARYGAGQLSRGAQRAPTHEDCEDGWRKVDEIVAASEAAAKEAGRVALLLDDSRARTVAVGAEGAAQAARRIMTERNLAYTFHASPDFSFGEGWYVAAAAILANIQVQVEPDRAHTQKAEVFLREAGLGSQLVPYRPRPPANKALPDLIAGAFRADPIACRRRLRAAFLGGAPVPTNVAEFVRDSLNGVSSLKKVLIWLRYAEHHSERNTPLVELAELCRIVNEASALPVLVGDALRGGSVPDGARDLTLFWKESPFQGLDMRRSQLQFFELLRDVHGLVGQVGVTTAGMDGPALMGLPTMYITDRPNVRLGRWVGAVPGYREVVRSEGYLGRIADTLRTWLST
jgi:hypothetical protein